MTEQERKDEKEHGRVSLTLARTKLGTASAVVVADEVTDRFQRDAVRVGAVVGAAYLVSAFNPLLVGGTYLVGKIAVRWAARRAERNLPALKARADALSQEVRARAERKGRVPRPEDVVPQGG